MVAVRVGLSSYRIRRLRRNAEAQEAQRSQREDKMRYSSACLRLFVATQKQLFAFLHVLSVSAVNTYFL